MHFEQHTELDNLITMQNLRTSANKGNNDACDVHSSLTGYEPNDMVFSELGDSQGSFSYITHSSDLDIDDATLGKLLDEAHRGQADYCNPEGVSVSQSSLSVVFDGTGKPVGENSSNAQIRTLLDEQRQMIIAEYCEKIGHHELQAAHAEEERRILREELWRQQMGSWSSSTKSYRDGGITKSQDESSSRTRTLLWNCQVEYKNYKMK